MGVSGPRYLLSLRMGLFTLQTFASDIIPSGIFTPPTHTHTLEEIYYRVKVKVSFQFLISHFHADIIFTIQITTILPRRSGKVWRPVVGKEGWKSGLAFIFQHILQLVCCHNVPPLREARREEVGGSGSFK